MERTNTDLLSSLAKFFCSIRTHQTWWYCVNLPASSPHSLARLLSIETCDMDCFLVAIGWYGKYGDSGALTVKPDKIQQFINLDPSYADFLELIPYFLEGKRRYWLRIGERDNHNTKPSVQVKLVEVNRLSPPIHVTSRAQRNFFQNYNQWVDACDALEEEFESLQSNVETTLPLTSNSSHPSVSPVPASTPTTKIECLMLSQGSLNQSYLGAKEHLKRVKVKLFLTPEEYMEADELERKQNAIAATLKASSREFSVMPEDYPVLKKYGIDVRNESLVQGLLYDLVKLQRDVWRNNSLNIFDIKTPNNSTCRLVEVPSATSWEQFRKNIHRKGKQNWIGTVLDAITSSTAPKNTKENDDALSLFNNNRSTAALWLMQRLGSKFSDEFVIAAKHIGMPMCKQPMSAPMTAAMWDAAGTSYASQRVICSYFLNHFGWRFCSSENKVRSLGRSAVQPVVADFKHNDHSGSFWYKDLHSLLCVKVVNAIQEGAHCFSLNDFASLDILIGADHGQGSLRAVTKFLLRNSSKEVLVEEVYSLAEVECKKDTAALVNVTIGPVINAALKKMIKYTRDSETGMPVSDGVFFVCANKESEQWYGGFNLDLTTYADLQVLQELPIRVMMTGDIKFYATMIGMEDHEGHWCWLCDLSKQEWEKNGHETGNERTLSSILDVARRYGGIRPTKAQKGVIMYPPIDSIELIRYVIPPLHLMLGITNQILKDFYSYVYKTLEEVSPVILQLREQEILKETVWKESKEALEAYVLEHGVILANSRFRRQEINKILQKTGNQRVQGDIRERLLLEKEGICTVIDALVKSRQQLEKNKQKKKKEWDLVKSNLKAEESKKGISRPLKASIEMVLYKRGIDPGAYHGGDLVGNHCRILLRSSAAIFDEVVKVMTEFATTHGKSNALLKPSVDRARATASTLTLFDNLFSLISRTSSEVTSEILNDIERVGKLAVKAWVSLKDHKGNQPPKIHLVSAHLHCMMKHYAGIGDFDESYVEAHHQFGKALGVRSRSMRDMTKRASCHANWEAIHKRHDVMCCKIENQKQMAKRAKRKKGKAEINEEEQKEDRENKRRKVLDEFEPTKLQSSRELLFDLMQKRDDTGSL